MYIRSFGSSWQMGNTPRHWLTNFNSLALFNLRWTQTCERRGLVQRPSTTLVLLYKIGFERPTVWKSVVGLLWALPFLLANYGIDWPPIRPLYFYHSDLWSNQGLAGVSRDLSKRLCESKYQGMVVLVGGWCNPTQKKALASLILLTVWKLWNKRNGRVFRNKHSPSFIILIRSRLKPVNGW
jgi:hypothetical protein